MENQKIGVIGAGIMGAGIAQVCATAGLDVILLDVSEAALARGMTTIGNSLDRLFAKGALSASIKDEALSRIATTTHYANLASADFVIEAASESESVKLAILGKLVEVVSPEAILASNTSSLSITRLAAATKRPERFIGMHFFNPVLLMPLIELIRGLQTSDATLQYARALSAKLGKTAIEVKNSPGFAVNRLLCPMINEAIFALQEGLASAEDIDAAMKLGCNHPVGPLALADMIGLDTLLSIMNSLFEEFGDAKYRPALLLREMVAAGRLGRKTKHGFYPYAEAR